VEQGENDRRAAVPEIRVEFPESRDVFVTVAERPLDH
jgi:hypothetical protein